jgi:superfamily I DNA/RNA helicase
MLAAKHRNVINASGCDDRYRWRGADVGIILQFSDYSDDRLQTGAEL